MSASLDIAFFLTSLLADETEMKALALGVEYCPAPPYSERKPEEIASRIAGLARAAEETGAQGPRARPLFEAI